MGLQSIQMLEVSLVAIFSAFLSPTFHVLTYLSRRILVFWARIKAQFWEQNFTLGIRVKNVHHQMLKISVRKSGCLPTECEIILGIIKNP